MHYGYVGEKALINTAQLSLHTAQLNQQTINHEFMA